MLSPRDYQLKAIEETLPHDGYGLFMQQRTGKTYTTLWIAQRWECRKILVICPKKGLPVWAEASKDLGVPVKAINFESFMRNYQSYLHPWDLVVIDESHRIKNRGSQVTHACWKLSKFARKRLILTGSPQGQGMEDYYAQLRFIRPDLFPTWGDFKSKYLIMSKVVFPGSEREIDKITGYRNQDEFKELLKTISFRVTREEVSTRKTLVRSTEVSITPSQEFKDQYMQLKKELYLELNDGGLVTAQQIMVRLMKLHQLCGGFIRDQVGETHHVNSDKLNALWELLDGKLAGVPLVIIVQYKAEVEHISQELTRRGITHTQIRGGHQYDPKDRSHITLLNPSAGESINLAHYSVMIVYSMNYSYLKWEQFKDRIVLVDTPEVKYYYLNIKGSMDEVIYRAVIKKKKLSDEVMSIYNNRSLLYNELSA